MAVIKVNGRVIEVPKVLLTYASPSFFLREFRGEQIGELDTQRFGLEERLHDLRIGDKGVAGFHEKESGLGRFDVDVLFPGIHVADDNDGFSFAYLIKGRPVLRKEDGSDFVVDVDPYYNSENFVPNDSLSLKFNLDKDRIKIYDRDGRFVGLIDRDKLALVGGVESNTVVDIKKCKVDSWGRFLDDYFDMRYAITGDINSSSGKIGTKGFVCSRNEVLLDLDYATKVLGLNFKERALSEPRTMITSPHPDVKQVEARGGEINAGSRRVPEVGSGPSVVVDPEFKDIVEGAYDIHGVPKPAVGVELAAEVITDDTREPSGEEINLDVEPLEFADGEFPFEGDATMRDLQEVDPRDQTVRELPIPGSSLERRVEDEVKSLLDRHSYFDALSIVQQKKIGVSAYDVVTNGVRYFVKIESYEDAISLAERSSDPELSKYAFMSICDKAMADKKYSVAIVHAKMVSPEYLDEIKRDALQRLERERNYVGAADILLLLGEKQSALSKLEEGRVYDRAIRLAEELGDNERVDILRRKARPLGEFRLSLEKALNSHVVPRLRGLGDFFKYLGEGFGEGFSGLYDITGSLGSSAKNGLVSATSRIGKSVRPFGESLSTGFGAIDWKKTGRRSLLLALGLAVGYGAFNLVTSPSQTKDEKEFWESARELGKKEDLNGALVYARRAQNAMNAYKRFFYGIPGIDSDYEDYANRVADGIRRALARKNMLVNSSVSTENKELIYSYHDFYRIPGIDPNEEDFIKILLDFEEVLCDSERRAQRVDSKPKQATKRVKASGLEGVTKRLGAYFGLSFREGDPYTSNFESEVRNQYETYVNEHGGINSGSFRFVYVVDNGTIRKAVLVRDGDGDALNFGKSLLGSIRGKKVQSPNGVYASNLYRFGGK